MKQTTAWKASDGSLHDTAREAAVAEISHLLKGTTPLSNTLLVNRGKLRSIFDQLDAALNPPPNAYTGPTKGEEWL
jgi:hypothetical protein